MSRRGGESGPGIGRAGRGRSRRWSLVDPAGRAARARRLRAVERRRRRPRGRPGGRRRRRRRARRPGVAAAPLRDDAAVRRRRDGLAVRVRAPSLVPGLPRVPGDRRSGAGARGTAVEGERGQASVELLAGIPALLLAGLSPFSCSPPATRSRSPTAPPRPVPWRSRRGGRPPPPSARRCPAGRVTGSASTSRAAGSPSPAPAIAARGGRSAARGQLVGLGAEARGRMSAAGPSQRRNGARTPACAPPCWPPTSERRGGSRPRRRSRSRLRSRSPGGASGCCSRSSEASAAGVRRCSPRRPRVSSRRGSAAPASSGSPRAAGSVGSGSRRRVEALGELPRMLAAVPAASLAIVHLPARLWPLALEERGLRPRAGCFAPIFQATGRWRRWRWPSFASGASLHGSPRGRSAGLPRAVPWPAWRPAARVARRVRRLARGLVGRTGAHAAERGQALLMVLGAAFAILFAASLLVALGGALTGTARAQRAVDLVALSGARSLRDDFPRLFTPPRLPGGAPNPRHLDRREYLARASPRRRARPPPETASIPTGCASRSPTPTPSRRFACGPRSSLDRPERCGAAAGAAGASAAGGAIRSRPAPRRWPLRRRRQWAARATTATGGGYSGPLAYRQGKPMRPDVARPSTAWPPRRAGRGSALVINSGLPLRRRAGARSSPSIPTPAGSRPRGIAPPLRDRARPRAAVRLRLAGRERAPLRLRAALRLGAVALRLRRGARRPARRRATPASRRSADGARGGRPAACRPSSPCASGRRSLRAAARWNVSAALLAAQLMAESNFNPFAVSPAGAQGIAQFMPGTAPPTASTTRSTPPPRSTPRRT